MTGKRYDCATPRPKADGGTFWQRVGSAFTNDKGMITVFLDAYPVPDKEGKVKIMLFEPKPMPQATPSLDDRPLSVALDDNIPY